MCLATLQNTKIFLLSYLCSSNLFFLHPNMGVTRGLWSLHETVTRIVFQHLCWGLWCQPEFIDTVRGWWRCWIWTIVNSNGPCHSAVNNAAPQTIWADLLRSWSQSAIDLSDNFRLLYHTPLDILPHHASLTFLSFSLTFLDMACSSSAWTNSVLARFYRCITL